MLAQHGVLVEVRAIGARGAILAAAAVGASRLCTRCRREIEHRRFVSENRLLSKMVLLRVDEVLQRFPATGPIFLQRGRMLEAGTGQMYPSYPAMTVADYAKKNGVAVETLLKAINAEVESGAFASPRLSPHDAGPEAR